MTRPSFSSGSRTPRQTINAEGETLEDMIDVQEFLLCGPTFEAFMFRFWIEKHHLVFASQPARADAGAARVR